MTNVFAPFGLQDIDRSEGGSPQYGLTKVSIGSSDATPIFNGDIVQLGNFQPVSGNFGKYITQGSSGLTGNNIGYEGIFRGCEFLNTTVGRVVWSNFWPGATTNVTSSLADAIAYIDQDFQKKFIVQATSAANITSSMIGIAVGLNTFGVTMTSTIGNLNSGFSGAGLASSNLSANSTSQTGGSSTPFRLENFYSNYAPGLFPGQPQTGATAGQLGFVNGTDNSSAAQIVVVRWAPTQLAQYSSAAI